MLNGLFLFTREHYDLNSISTLKLKKIDTVYFGSEDLSSFAKKIWKLAPDIIKNEKSLLNFKSKIKGWITHKHPC